MKNAGTEKVEEGREANRRFVVRCRSEGETDVAGDDEGQCDMALGRDETSVI